MRWDVVVPAWLVPIAADSVVQRVLGTDPAFSMAGERRFEIASMEYQLVTRGLLETEVSWRTVVQLDYWVRTMQDLIDLEKALIRLAHSDVAVTIGGHRMWTELVGDGGPLLGADQGSFTGSLDFRLRYIRGQFTS